MIQAVVRSCLSGLIIGLTAVVFSISFTAIIYTGDLVPFLSRGIGLTLAGAAVMAVVGAFTLSYPGTIVQPQDVTALILSIAAASIAAGWQDAAPRTCSQRLPYWLLLRQPRPAQPRSSSGVCGSVTSFATSLIRSSAASLRRPDICL